MSIHIVTHCYAGKLPQYAQFLRLHLSSLTLYRPQVETKITVCATPGDKDTVEVLAWFGGVYRMNLYVQWMQPEELFVRCIGRNKVALANESDLVWFADVDQVFHQGCLDTLWETWQGFAEPKPIMIWPRHIMIQEDHNLGDELVAWLTANPERLVAINPSQFVPHRYSRAIGGVQIVDGKIATGYGYLDGHKFQQPKEKPFASFRDDVIYRAHFCRELAEKLGRKHTQSIELPGLYRCRHTEKTY